jgi:carboxylate-amine ligase
MNNDFVPSEPLTVGVELELQLIDRDGYGLVNGIKPLIEIYPGSRNIKPEFVQNTVQLVSDVGHTVGDVHANLIEIGRGLKDRCASLGMLLCGAGTHPFDRSLAPVTPLPRFLRIEEDYGILGNLQVTYATHVHIGVSSAEDAIFLFRTLKPYLPLFIALSASSPFWHGYDTGYAAYRHRVLAAARSYGIPPSFEDWKQFEDFCNASRRAGMIDSMRDVHWDIRPRPHLGTVEARVMDAQPTIGEAMELAALVRSLAACLLDSRDQANSLLLPHALHWWTEHDNHFKASRLGMDADCVYTAHGDTRSLRSLWDAVVEAVLPHADALGERDYVDRLAHRIAEGDISYLRQRREYERDDDLAHVVEALVAELEDELV